MCICMVDIKYFIFFEGMKFPFIYKTFTDNDKSFQIKTNTIFCRMIIKVRLLKLNS